MSNANVGVQGRTSAGVPKAVLVDSTGRLITSPAGGAFLSQNNLIATSAGAYAAGDVVGITPSTATSPEGASGANGLYTVDSVAIVDIQNVKADLEVWFFTGDPGALAVLADNAAFDWSNSVGAGFCGKVSIAGADWSVAGGEAVASVSNMGLIVQASLVGIIGWVVIAQSAAAYGAHSPTLRVSIAGRRV